MKATPPGKILNGLAGNVLFLLPAGIFGTWALLFIQLHFNQKLAILQSPRFHPYTLAAASVLLLLACLWPLLFRPSGTQDNLSPSTVIKSLAALLILGLPITAFLLLPPNFTTPSFLLDRAWSLAASSSSAGSGSGRVDPAAVKSFILNSDASSPLVLTPSDLLVVQDEPELKKVLQNRQVEMIGQWTPSGTNQAGEFRLVRLLMVCCAADARPIGVLTRGNVESPNPGSWFKATGTLDFSDPKESVVLKADQVESIDPPEDIFLY